MTVEAVVDFAPIADLVVEYGVIVIGAVFSAGIAWLGKKLNTKYGLEIEAKNRAALQDTFHYAINFGAGKVKEMYGTKLTKDLKNPLVAMATSYVIQSVPDTLKSFGIDPNSEAGRMKVADMVDARLSEWLFEEDDVVEAQPELPLDGGVDRPDVG
jgi:hypothetical protein